MFCDKFDDLYTSRARNASDFYQAFFHHLICPFQPHFTDPTSLRTLHRHIERFFGTHQLDFVAIDSTCGRPLSRLHRRRAWGNSPAFA
jgi:hypothetical protein